ncbi:MAG: hypothetical protein AAFN30_09305, partial [Actinomycetota bacterium]
EPRGGPGTGLDVGAAGAAGGPPHSLSISSFTSATWSMAPDAESDVVDPTLGDESGAAPELDLDPDAIFRRAAKDEPPRPRRKPKAIYIESQLDDEPGDEPRAVNYP